MPKQPSLRVLIVEDDRTSRFVLGRMLQATGEHEIHEAEDGQKAWEKLTAGLRPDLCFLDVNMPRLNGLELLRMIREDPRFAGLRVCFCSAVRDRPLVMQAAALKPNDYILKPYSREAIHAQVRRAMGMANPTDSLESARAVCSRLGIDDADYAARLDGLKEHVLSMTVRLPTLLMQFDVNGVFAALDKTRNMALQLGARRLHKLSDVLVRAIEANGGLLDTRNVSKEQAAMHFQQWLSRSADQLMQTIQDFRTEVQTIDRIVATARGAAESGTHPQGDLWARDEAELAGLVRALTGLLPRGKLITTSQSRRSRSLTVPIRADVVGSPTPQTLGTLIRKTTLAFPILDPKVAKAIEECRRIHGLVQLLSFPLDGGARWIPDSAIGLLEAEISARNAQAGDLLRQAIGSDSNDFLSRLEARLREDLGAAYRESNPSATPPEEQIQEILGDVRDRLNLVLGGTPASEAEYTTLEFVNLAASRDDAAWAAPFALLYHAARLQRAAHTDAAFERTYVFATCDGATFLQAMDVFGDAIAGREEPELAEQGIHQLEAIQASPVSLLEKCRLVWGIIRPRSGPGSDARNPAG